MPRYEPRKHVEALKVDIVVPEAGYSPTTGGCMLYFESENYEPVLMNLDWCYKHKPHEGGYYVCHEDGYRSFMTAEDFEREYTAFNS